MVSFRNKVLFASLLLAAAIPAEAQRRSKGKPLEAGIMLGASNYMGELTTSVAINETHGMGGIITRYNFSSGLTLRGSALFGRISGDDKNYDDDAFRKKRNLSFRSNVMEFSGTLEFNLGGYSESRNSYAWSPYLFIGAGLFKYNPKAYFEYIPGVHDNPTIYPAQTLKQYDGKWIELQPLSTEGQETTKYNDKRRYPLTQVSIPFGIGFKRQFNEDWAWGVEFGMRKTFTDYLDDVSSIYVDDQIIGGANGDLAVALKDRSYEVTRDENTRFAQNDLRGNSKQKDWYMFLGFTLTRKILGGKTVCYQF